MLQQLSQENPQLLDVSQWWYRDSVCECVCV